MVPLNESRAFSTVEIDKSTGFREVVSPSASYVSVVTPNLITALYSLVLVRKYSVIRVACPKHIGITPVARGSRVPPCPTRFIPLLLLRRLTTSMDVRP